MCPLSAVLSYLPSTTWMLLSLSRWVISSRGQIRQLPKLCTISSPPGSTAHSFTCSYALTNYLLLAWDLLSARMQDGNVFPSTVSLHDWQEEDQGDSVRQVACNSVRDLRCRLQTPGLHCLPIRLRWFPCQNRQGGVGVKRRLHGEPLAAWTTVTFVPSVYPSFVYGEHQRLDHEKWCDGSEHSLSAPARELWGFYA